MNLQEVLEQARASKAQENKARILLQLEFEGQDAEEFVVETVDRRGTWDRKGRDHVILVLQRVDG